MGDLLGGTNPIPSYLQICTKKNLKFPKVAVGEKFQSSLLLLICGFFVLGTFDCTAAAAVAGLKAETNLAPQAMVKEKTHP